jgi:hypothetical protein
MTRSTIAGRAIAIVIILLALAVARRMYRHDVNLPPEPSPAASSSTGPMSSEDDQGFLYGRLIISDGTTYEGRLRWHSNGEAFWGDYFNGFKDKNPWVAYVPPDQLKESRPVKIFGLEIGHRERQKDQTRPFIARFGDIARFDANDNDLQVTLKSGTVFHLDRDDASDFSAGIRVWDNSRGVMDIKERRIRSIELLHSGQLDKVPTRLRGIVRTRQGDFTGFVQWNRKECIGPDTLDGRTATGALSVRFDAIRSIARRSNDSALVTMLDGRSIVLSDAREVGHENRGIYVDDSRYGRVLISWDAFERVDFTPGGSGPAYGDFPPGRPLQGTVITLAGRRFTGRLVYDLDESEVADTLDAPSQGLNYDIPFGMIASIVITDGEEPGAQRARVTLHSGEELQLERTGDLGPGNSGILIFVDGHGRPEYVRWTDVEQIGLDRPPAMYPPLGER